MQNSPGQPTGGTGLQLDCLHGLRTTQRYVLVFPLSSFSWRVCRTKRGRWKHESGKRGSGDAVSNDQTLWQLSGLTDNNYEQE